MFYNYKILLLCDDVILEIIDMVVNVSVEYIIF